MSLWDRVTNMIAVGAFQENVPQLETRSDSIEDLVARLGWRAKPWRIPSIREALGTPAIFRAVSLIANTTGSLAVEGYRQGLKLTDIDTPRIVQRPDPFKTPRVFYRDSAYYLASRGECWWWIAKRDVDGQAMSLIVVRPWEIRVEATRDRLRPRIMWQDTEMPREDMRLITFMPDDNDEYRGVGPLQLCGAAVSVAVEAQEWAANFYADGGNPSTIIKSATQLGAAQNLDGPPGDDQLLAQSEADLLRAQWINQPNNVPRVIDTGIESVTNLEYNPNGAQMLDARQHENSNAARMFGIPGSLLEAQQSGSSLTYTTVEGEFTKFVKASLAPGYLEPIEQELSDLLPRTTVARFAIKGFLRADTKTRWEVYELASKVLGLEEAAQMARENEGLVPGDIEYAPVPFAAPQAFPASLPVQIRSVPEPVRCDGTRVLRGILRPCAKLLAEQGPFVGTCRRCGKVYEAVAA